MSLQSWHLLLLVRRTLSYKKKKHFKHLGLYINYSDIIIISTANKTTIQTNNSKDEVITVCSYRNRVKSDVEPVQIPCEITQNPPIPVTLVSTAAEGSRSVWIYSRVRRKNKIKTKNTDCLNVTVHHLQYLLNLQF